MTRTTGFNADGSQLWLRSAPADMPGPNPAQARI